MNREQNQNCGWCQGEIASGTTVARCEECGTLFHEGCLQEWGRCINLECEAMQLTYGIEVPGTPGIVIGGDSAEAPGVLEEPARRRPRRPELLVATIPSETTTIKEDSPPHYSERAFQPLSLAEQSMSAPRTVISEPPVFQLPLEQRSDPLVPMNISSISPDRGVFQPAYGHTGQDLDYEKTQIDLGQFNGYPAQEERASSSDIDEDRTKTSPKKRKKQSTKALRAAEPTDPVKKTPEPVIVQHLSSNLPESLQDTIPEPAPETAPTPLDPSGGHGGEKSGGASIEPSGGRDGEKSGGAYVVSLVLTIILAVGGYFAATMVHPLLLVPIVGIVLFAWLLPTVGR